MKNRFSQIFALVFLFITPALAQTREIRINLVDPAGKVVTDASVSAASGKLDARSCPKADDSFVCTVADSGGVRFDIRANGFKPLKMDYAARDITCCEYVFVLQKAEP